VHDTAANLANSVSDLKHALVRVVRTSSDDVDRRQAQRFGVDLPCHLTIGSELRVARLVDISAGGAAIRDGGTMAPNTRGKLRMAGVGFELPFVARESDDGLLHVAFELEGDMLEKFSAVPERLAMRAAA
jgi:methyl-accepting chemotaxis protein